MKNETNTIENLNVPSHIKIILSKRTFSCVFFLEKNSFKGCNWLNAKSMAQFIHLARDYSQEIVGIDFYGQEDDCRKYWHDFCKFTKILHRHQIRCQTSIQHYKDLQLIEDVIKGLSIERVCEGYEILQSSEYMENILMQRAVHLIICPLSDAYTLANHRKNDISSETGQKRKYQSTTSLDLAPHEKNSNEEISYDLINYLKSESINYSITSLSSIAYQQNLSSIYKNLFEKNSKFFTCEHVTFSLVILIFLVGICRCNG